jgi:hypothetical protein
MEKYHSAQIELHTTNNDMTADDMSFLANFSDEQRKKVLRKLDRRLVPMLAFLYLIAYLDRANIGMFRPLILW